MHEVMTQILGHARGMWRYRWYAMALAWVVALGGWLYVASLPDEYKAEARLYVDTESLLRPLLRGLAVQPGVHHRIDLLTRTLFSRPSLEKVARMTDLDLTAKSPAQMERLLDDLRDNVHLNSARGSNLYRISYMHSDPDRAKEVVQSFVTLFVEEGLGEGLQETNTAQRFLDKQIKEYEKRLEEAEKRLAQFKRKHAGIMPGDEAGYYERLKNAREKLEQAKLNHREAKRRRAELERRLKADAGGSIYLDHLPGGGSPIQSALDRRIEDLQKKLDELLLKYTEQHPDVKAIHRTIAQLKEQREEEREAAQRGGGGNVAQRRNGQFAPSGVPQEQAFQQQMRLALSQVDADVAAMQVRVNEYQARVERLEKLVDTLPRVETQLKQLNRDYRVTQNKYQALLERRETARLSEDVKSTGEDVQFRVVDPPRVPSTPAAPDRRLLSLGVLLLALGAGVGVAFLISQLRPVFDTRRSLQEGLGLPVFGSVSMVWTRGMLMRRRLEGATFLAAGLALLGASAVVTANAQKLGAAGPFIQTATGWI
mgnify:CR=1 FL=1